MTYRITKNPMTDRYRIEFQRTGADDRVYWQSISVPETTNLKVVEAELEEILKNERIARAWESPEVIKVVES